MTNVTSENARPQICWIMRGRDPLHRRGSSNIFQGKSGYSGPTDATDIRMQTMELGTNGNSVYSKSMCMKYKGRGVKVGYWSDLTGTNRR